MKLLLLMVLAVAAFVMVTGDFILLLVAVPVVAFHYEPVASAATVAVLVAMSLVVAARLGRSG